MNVAVQSSGQRRAHVLGMINARSRQGRRCPARARGPRASMRACSNHADPGPGQGNVLWIGLWMIYVNTLVDPSTAVDERCCGKVDSRVRHRVMPGRWTSVIHRATRSYPQASPQRPVAQYHRPDRLTLTLSAGDLRTGGFTDRDRSAESLVPCAPTIPLLGYLSVPQVCYRARCQFRDSRSRTIRMAAAGDPLTKPKNGPKSCVAEKPVMYRPARSV